MFRRRMLKRKQLYRRYTVAGRSVIAVIDGSIKRYRYFENIGTSFSRICCRKFSNLIVLKFIVSRSGEVGLTYEHSPAEGQPIAIMMDYIVDYV